MNEVGITGYGAVTPYGIGASESFSKLVAGEQAYDLEHGLDLASDFYKQKKIASIDIEMLNKFPVGVSIHPEALATKMTIISLLDALSFAEIKIGDLKKYKVGIVISTLESEALEKLALLDPKDVQFSIYKKIADPEYCVNLIRSITGAKGPSIVVNNACASGNHAISAGYDMISSGEVDIVLTGGGCKIFKSGVAGFHQFQGISLDTCRPFDASRSGTMLGDGAGMMVMESLRHISKRNGSSPRIVVSGYGASCDAYDMIMPHPEGHGMISCMSRAIEHANLSAADICYINAHGTGTVQNDRLETSSIREVFGEHANKLIISSTKALLGHCLYAASAIEAVWCCCIIDQGIIPGTWNSINKDDECELNYLNNSSKKAQVKHCMNNSFGFGGTNASVIFSKAF